MKRIALGSLVALVTISCKTSGGASTVKEGEGGGSGNGSGVVGLDILTDTPAVTKIAASVQPETDWAFSSGREYWLYSTRGRYMTFDADGFYAPYQNQAACEGKTEDPASACSVKPSAVAKECQRIASLTLNALFETEPAEYAELKQKYGGSFQLFGWLNDAYSDRANATKAWQGPFIWRGSQAAIQVGGTCPADFKSLSGYIKWVSSVDADGECKTPSKGQLLALLKAAKSCLEKNAAE